MRDSEVVAATTLPPGAQLVQMFAGSWVAVAVYTAAKLGIADHLAGGARSAVELAPPMGAHAPSLHRFMRTLAGLGILTEVRASLRPDSARRGAAHRRARRGAFDAAHVWRASHSGARWDEILYSLETGKPAFEKAFGHADLRLSRPASRGRVAVQRDDGRLPRHGAAAVAEAYDFSGIRPSSTSAAPPATCSRRCSSRIAGPRGVLYDLPHVVRDAPALCKSRGVDSTHHDRGGQLLRAVPAGGRRLCAVAHHPRLERGAVPDHPRPLPQRHDPNGRLLIVEMVLPDGERLTRASCWTS